MTSECRPNLPDLPRTMAHLPFQRGYPVPYFVTQLENGTYDFRVVDGRKLVKAIKERRCWVCGQALGSMVVFSIGPMCAVNRINSEPPSHSTCAEYAVKACPFLNQTEIKRNVSNLPEGVRDPAGIAIDRQPGVIALWWTKSYKLFEAEGGSGFLIELGKPYKVDWYSRGIPATREQIVESINSGLPALLEVCESEEEIQEVNKRTQHVINKVLATVPPTF